MGISAFNRMRARQKPETTPEPVVEVVEVEEVKEEKPKKGKKKTGVTKEEIKDFEGPFAGVEETAETKE